ncbi:uncharacterized protein LOC143245122 isoform X2 [Tachypleus tridentatus]|uniref:uncharacterized protein LOC143245122 isoform X2 n=1 Tax=Tachypleus tridentatus TaxID=6853 RepID=UPI003FD67791
MPRKLKSQDGNPYEAIRGLWEGAYVSQFIRLFQGKFGFPSITVWICESVIIHVVFIIQDLEDSLVDGSSVLVPDVCARLLRFLTAKKDTLIENFETTLYNLVNKEKGGPLQIQDRLGSWKELSPENKLNVLKWLVDHVYKKKEDDLAEYLDENYSSDDLRGICVGQDAFNNFYWYLDDLRLYRENSFKKPNKKEWECVCVSLADWQSFLKQFRKTSNIQERELHTYLNFQLFPLIESQLKDLESKKKNRETENLKLLEREQKEVGIMLEKKVTCNGGSGTAASLVNVNGVDSLNHDSVNKTIKTASEATENGLEEFLPKVEATKTECDIKMNICENKGSLVNSNNTSSNKVNGNKDITSGVMNNSCSNLSSNSCGTSGQEGCQDGANVIVNGSNCPTAGNPKTSAQSMDTSQDATLPLLTDNRSEGSVSSNKENAPPSAVVNTTDLPPVSAISNMMCSTVSVPTLSYVQPLPSNMLNKSSVSMETQYMQQQSQIFVFSTTLANKAAETVISGHFPSIIAFHCNQPITKRFLEKHPLKVHQFNRQNASPWFNSLAQGKQNKQLKVGGVGPLPGSSMVNHQLTSGQPMCSGPCMVHGNASCSISGGSSGWSGHPIGTSGLGPCGSSDMNPRPGVFHWGTHQQQGVLHGMNMNPHQKFQPHMSNLGQPSGMRPMVRGMLPGNIGGPVGSNISGCCSNPGTHYPGAPSEPCGTSQVQSSLTGVKIPDENLTPQQRQHREEQLAMIRKMQQWLFPDQQGNEVPPSSEPIMNSQGVMLPGGMGGHGCVSGTEMCPQPGMEMMCGQGCLMGDHHPHPSSDGGMYHVPSSMIGPQYPTRQNVPPSSMAAQMEWQKLQQQFIEERQKKPSVSHPSPMGQQPQPAVNSPNPNVGMSPNTRVQGPPPPYPNPHGAMPSPHPSSPNLSMSSPRMPSVTSPTEPSRQFSHLTPPGSRMPHPSPGGGVNNSLHSTPMNSPKPPPSSSACNGQTSGNIRTSNSSSINTTSTVGPILPSFSPMGTNSSRKASGQQTSVSSLDINSTMMTNQTSVSSLTQSTSSDVFSTNCGHHPCNSVPSCHKNVQNPEHTLQSGTLGKEASLMPVPSPQQIMYLNSFDGQELTIQKQPNTSLEADLMSPARLSTDTSQSFPRSDGIQGPLPVSTMCGVPDNMNAQSYVSLQASLVDSNQLRYPLSNQMAGYDNNPRFINTPPQGVDLGMQRFAVPQNSSLEEMARMAGGGTLERFPSGISIGNGLRPSSSNMEGIQRFTSSNNGVEIMNRFRGPNSGVEMMQPRYPGVGTHLMGPDGIQPHPQFPPSGAETIQPHQYASPAQTLISNESHSHLHSLQKMTPPFDIPPGVKLSSEIAQHGTVSQMCSGPPQLSYQHMGSQKLTHFDPLGSIAAMSDSAGSASSTVSQTQQSMMTTTMNMSSMHVSGNLGNNPNQPHVVNFNTSMQAVQGVQQSMTQQGGSDGAQGQQQYMGSQMAHNMGGGPQTVNNTYVNATMSIQQLNIQNVTTPTFSPTIHHPHSSVVQGQHMGAHTVSSSVTSNQSIAHSSVSQKPSVNMSGVGPRGPNQPQPFPGHPVGGQRMMSPLGAAMGQGMIAKHTGPPGIPYNTTNVHVKASAPNTIQYLPARPTVATPGSTRPPSLEFLQRFATPLTNLDAKVPTHNLQYFPGVTPVNSNIGPPLGPSGPGQVMINTQRPVSIGAGAMLRGPPVSHQVITGGEMYPGPCGPGGNDPAMFGQPPRLQGNGMMSISGIGGGQGGGMFPGKQTQISPAGMADVSQPLQPSLGHSMNYKHSPLYAPTTADPNYAVQFHNFQQQLYATNTRGSQSGLSSGQTFFGPK